MKINFSRHDRVQCITMELVCTKKYYFAAKPMAVPCQSNLHPLPFLIAIFERQLLPFSKDTADY